MSNIAVVVLLDWFYKKPIAGNSLNFAAVCNRPAHLLFSAELALVKDSRRGLEFNCTRSRISRIRTQTHTHTHITEIKSFQTLHLDSYWKKNRKKLTHHSRNRNICQLMLKFLFSMIDHIEILQGATLKIQFWGWFGRVRGWRVVMTWNFTSWPAIILSAWFAAHLWNILILLWHRTLLECVYCTGVFRTVKSELHWGSDWRWPC